MLVRPSYVLSGAAMRVVVNDQQLKDFLEVRDFAASFLLDAARTISTRSFTTEHCSTA